MCVCVYELRTCKNKTNPIDASRVAVQLRTFLSRRPNSYTHFSHSLSLVAAFETTNCYLFIDFFFCVTEMCFLLLFHEFVIVVNFDNKWHNNRARIIIKMNACAFAPFTHTFRWCTIRNRYFTTSRLLLFFCSRLINKLAALAQTL